MFSSRLQRRLVTLTRWHRKSRRLRPVSIKMTVSNAVTVASQKHFHAHRIARSRRSVPYSEFADTKQL